MSNKIKKRKKKLKQKPVESEEIDEEQEYDASVYELLYNFIPKSSCLSFNVIPDNLGNSRKTYPFKGFLVAGTQASHFNKNSLMVIKMENLQKTLKTQIEEPDESSSDSSSEEENMTKLISKTPTFESALIHHEGGINRLKLSQLSDDVMVCATWSESRKVHIWSLKDALQAVNDSRYMHKYINVDKLEYNTKPVYTFGGHMEEGFALDWSPVKKGRLATGDNKSHIHLWNMLDQGLSWHVNQIPFASHTQSVEDIQWSPSEADVFASCSVDQSIKIWDVRAKPTAACMLTASHAHDSDINVISWNTREQYFLVSGGDDGVLKIWDLREFKEGKPMAVFKYHNGPITSVEWKPDESSVFAASGGDDKLTIWDLSLEKDDLPTTKCNGKQNNGTDPTEPSVSNTETENEEEAELKELQALDDELPPYLLFVHEGQREIKELHWHPQIPGLIIDTANTGINIFKTINV